MKKSPYRDNTIVIVNSDHGWHLGEKHHWRKFTLWQEATRSVLVIRDPRIKKAAKGQICSEAVSLMDIPPTLYELCGFPSLEGLDGQSLVPQMINPKRRRQEPALMIHDRWGHISHAVRDRDWLLIHYWTADEELYYHPTDPYEWNNLAKNPKYEKERDRLRAWLTEKPLRLRKQI